MAVPESDAAKVELLASLRIIRLPLLIPVEVGAYITVKVLLCPADRVSGRDSPLALKPGPLTLTCEILSAEPPVLVKVCDWVLLVPT